MTANSTIFFSTLAPLVAAIIGIAVLLRHCRRPPQTVPSGVLGTSLADLRRQRIRFIRELKQESSYSPGLLFAEFGPAVEALPAEHEDLVAADEVAVHDVPLRRAA